MRLRRSEWLVRLSLVFLLLYGAIAISDRGHEKFPFFAWDLFTKVPQQQSADFSVRLIQAQGVRVPLPVYFEASRVNSLVAQIQGYKAIQVLGLSIVRRDGRAAALRKHFESTYLSSLRNVRYQVVRRVYDARQRVDCRTCYIRVRVVATYSTG
jgi:hypothetical protein